MNQQRFACLSALALACAAGYGCGSDVTGSGATGTGGASTSTSTSPDTSASTGVATSVGGAGTSSGDTSSGQSSAASSSASSTGTGSVMPGCTAKNGAVLAVTKFYFGDTNFDDTTDKVNAWRQYGFNLDGKVSTATSVDLCQPQNNAPPKNVYPDGNNGNDNAFGKNVLPIFLAFDQSFAMKANAAVTAGDHTVLIDLVGLGAASEQAPQVARVYEGAPLGAAPKFDGSDCWPVAPEALNDPTDIASSKAGYPSGAVTTNHWDSGATGGELRLLISIDGYVMHLDLHAVRLAMTLDPDHQGAQLGQLGGVVSTAQLQDEVKKLAGNFDPSLCKGATIDSIVAQIGQASDILFNGTQDPAKTCDGISIGLGFKASAVSLGVVGPAEVPSPNNCAP